MKRNLFGKLIGITLAIGVMVTNTIFASAFSEVSPIIINTKDMVAIDQETFSVAAGTKIEVKQNSDFSGNILTIRVSDISCENEFYFYDRGTDWGGPNEPAIAPVTITFGNFVDDYGNSVNLAESGKEYILAVEVLEYTASGEEIYYTTTPAYFRVAEGSSPGSQQATPNSSNVLINEKAVEFDAYTINQNNYFKLRDLAKVLSGTGKQFNVTWDGSKDAINLTSGKPYISVGGEMAKGDSTPKEAKENTSTIYVNGETVALTAYTINGNNYFKLRDLGKLLDFNVLWNGANNTITIDTTKGYLDEQIPDPNANKEGYIYVPGFGWVKDPGQAVVDGQAPSFESVSTETPILK